MSSRSPARWLAPLALVVAIVAVVVIAGASNGGKSSDDNGTGTTSTRPHSTSATGHPTRTRPARIYVVKPGDVLSAIAEKTGVPLERIERLNPNVDAQSLHAGQKLKLEP